MVISQSTNMLESICAICQMEMTAPSELTNCQKNSKNQILHKFCFVCLEQWCIKNYTCPMCRIPSKMLYCDQYKTWWDIDYLRQIRKDILKTTYSAISRFLALKELQDERHILQLCIRENDIILWDPGTLPHIRCVALFNKTSAAGRSDSILILLQDQSLFCTKILVESTSCYVEREFHLKVKKYCKQFIDNCYKSCIVNSEDIIQKLKDEVASKITDIFCDSLTEIFNSNLYYYRHRIY